MSPTEFMLLAIHKAPAVALQEVSLHYLGLSAEHANRAAGANRLPFPTFRLSDSRKAPWMVNICDLARHIDERHQQARARWVLTQD